MHRISVVLPAWTVEPGEVRLAVDELWRPASVACPVRELMPARTGNTDDFSRLPARPPPEKHRHEAIGWQRPLDRYLQTPEPSNPTDPEPEQES